MLLFNLPFKINNIIFVKLLINIQFVLLISIIINVTQVFIHQSYAVNLTKIRNTSLFLNFDLQQKNTYHLYVFHKDISILSKYVAECS